MEISTLNLLLKSVRDAAPDRKIIVFGSSSLFASFPDTDPELIGTAVTTDHTAAWQEVEQGVAQNKIRLLRSAFLESKSGMRSTFESGREVSIRPADAGFRCWPQSAILSRLPAS